MGLSKLTHILWIKIIPPLDKMDIRDPESVSLDLMMYSALAEPAVEGGGPSIRILLIAYAVYG